MRLFFALGLNNKDKDEIDHFRSRIFTNTGKKIAKENFHITLVFLGNSTEEQYQTLLNTAQTIQAHTFKLQLNQVGYWPRPKILWLGPDHCPSELQKLVGDLNILAKSLSFRIEERPYQAHISLFRKYKITKEKLNFQTPPSFKLECNHFSLFESKSSEKGVQYKTLHSWKLDG